MSSKKKLKTCLVISYGPVPTPQYQTIEGGGMRIWGLAKGLQENGVEVTIGVNDGFPQDTPELDGIKLINWRLDGDFAQTLNTFDSVIVSYCMGDLSVFVADHISDNVQLVLDAYVPIYIEVSARDAQDMNIEYKNYMADLERHNHTLRRGDYFLYANPAQEQLYSGVLSALGIINPHSYRDQRLLYTPFGIHRDTPVANTNPYIKLGVKESDFVVLWFGGIYPWFRIEEYLGAINKLASDKQIKFIFIGGKNPFNPNEDIARQYNKTYDFAKQKDLIGKSVFFVDWVDFNTRIDWFKHAQVLISLNQPGSENKYSWRTRVMDFVWGELATITNGGDPLSDEMIQSDAAVQLYDLSAESIENSIRELMSRPARLEEVRQNVRLLKDKYFWDTVTKGLSTIIKQGDLPYRKELPFKELLPIQAEVVAGTKIGDGKLSKLVIAPYKIARKVKQKGIRRSAGLAHSIITTQIKEVRAKSSRESQFVFISHPIDYSGAPVVLLQILEEYAHKYGANRIRLIAPAVHDKTLIEKLKKLGIKPEQAIFGASFRLVRLQLGLRSDDFVFINTIAIYDSYRDFVMLWLRLGRLKHAYWFIHEDMQQIPIINKPFLDQQNISTIRHLADKHKLTLLYPSQRTLSEYRELLNVEGGYATKLNVEVPETYRRLPKKEDFETIDILLSGSSSDGRKGQMLALSALQRFVDTLYKNDTKNYRKITLHLLAVGDKDYISKQVRWIAESALSDYVELYPSVPKEEALKIASKCNTVLCCSLNETFGLYIAEGMLMGHVVIRNSSAGVDEQLIPGKNGLLIDHTDIESIISAYEMLANKSTTSNAKLTAMGQFSRELMEDYTKQSYISQIEHINKKD